MLPILSSLRGCGICAGTEIDFPDFANVQKGERDGETVRYCGSDYLNTDEGRGYSHYSVATAFLSVRLRYRIHRLSMLLWALG